MEGSDSRDVIGKIEKKYWSFDRVGVVHCPLVWCGVHACATSGSSSCLMMKKGTHFISNKYPSIINGISPTNTSKD